MTMSFLCNVNVSERCMHGHVPCTPCIHGYVSSTCRPLLTIRPTQVTGGSAGIGRAAALAFGANGARVAVMGRRKERLDAVVERLPTGLAVMGDLNVPEDCMRAVAETVEAFGGLDILVSNGVQRFLCSPLPLHPCHPTSTAATNEGVVCLFLSVTTVYVRLYTRVRPT